MTNKIVFFDIQIGRTKIGRVKFELFSQYLPQTCQNFRQLCTGQYIKNGKPTGFKETCLFEIAENYLRGGDYNKNNGTGGESAYAEEFLEISQINKQESDKILKQTKGKSWILSMVKNSHGKIESVFEISQQWDGTKQQLLVPFGYAVEEPSLKVLKTLTLSQTNESGKPKIPIIIFECGQM